MKHLTKDWFRAYLATYTLCRTTASDLADRDDDAAYKTAVTKQKDDFVRERLSVYENSRQAFSKTELVAHAEKLFYSELKNIENALSVLPKTFRNHIADLRFLVLGLCKTTEVEFIDRYNEKLHKKLEEVAAIAHRETDCAQDYLSDELDLDCFTDATLSEILFEKSDLILKFSDNYDLCIKNATVLYREKAKIFRHSHNNPFTGETRLCASELTYDEKENNFVFDALFDNYSENGAESFWCITVKGDCLYKV